MAQNEDYSMFVPKVHFEQIPIRNLVSNQEYQRPLSKRHVKRAAEEFDLYQINPVKVSRRDGINYVFNGQHTVEIVALVSGSRDTPVWCMIYDDLDYSHEADIFANQQKGVKPLVPLEIFKANLEAQNDKQVIIKKTVEQYHMKIGPSQIPGNICAVKSLESIYDTYGNAMLDKVLCLLIGTWQGETQSLSSQMLLGTALLLDAYKDKVDDEVFKERMSSQPIKAIIREAKERNGGSLGYAAALWKYYNSRTRGPVDFEPLYVAKKKAKKGRMAQLHTETEISNQETDQEPRAYI